MKKLLKSIVVLFVVSTMWQCQNVEKHQDEASHKESSQQEQADHHHHDSKSDQKYVTDRIEVVGDVKNALSLTVDSLKLMNVKEVSNMDIVCQSGATVQSIKSTKGILLRDILEKAQIDQLNHKDRNFYIVARATDDYKATFSWAEIFNNPTGDEVYVVFEQNGEPLKEKGEMIVVSNTDVRTGPRHVTWLKSIEVTRVK